MAQLSIIIPVYRVEQTLDRCVRSVLCCERRDIEVLLVDDGSPDSCGTLCDQWAERDGRVKVLHKRNGGLSDARNAGIDASHGDLLMFVDSDDELAPGTIEAAMKTMEEDEACDIAEFGVLRVNHFSDDQEETACSKPADGSCSKQSLFLKGELVFDPKTVSETHYADMRLYWLRTRAYTHSYACNKIYRRRLFQDVRYPVGRVFEDMFTLPPLLLRAKRLRIIPHGCYIYHINSSGITACADNDASMTAMLLTASIEAWRLLDIDNAPRAERKLKDLYYMHILNIQITTYLLGGKQGVASHKSMDSQQGETAQQGETSQQGASSQQGETSQKSEASQQSVVLPMRRVVPWHLPRRFVLKAFALHLLGVEGVCKLFSCLKAKRYL